MRAEFFRALEELAHSNNDIFILTGDLGFKLFDSFKSRFPERFYDIGVAESNMIGIASGLALSRKTVYCYSIIPFLIMKTYEQIRNDVANHNLNIKLVGVGGGFTYGLEGMTHFGLEDFALMRLLPNIAIVAPADLMEAQCLAKSSYEHKGPMYIRLGRSNESVIHETPPAFKIGKSIFIKEGKNIALFAIGNMVHVGKQVADLLSKIGIEPTLINTHTLKPLDTQVIVQIASAHEFIFSLEEHYINGGLGSAIAETLIENGYKGCFKRFGIPERLRDIIGNADYLRCVYGLTPEKIYNNILDVIK